jgi:hypothetical protein
MAGETEAQMKAEKAARDAAPKERGRDDLVLTISDRNHLRRAMNLCVWLFYNIKEKPGHSCWAGSAHTPSRATSGSSVRRCADRGQWRGWLGAEAYASPVIRVKTVPGLQTRGSTGRIPISGGIVAAFGEEDETAITLLLWMASGSAESRKQRAPEAC